MVPWHRILLATDFSDPARGAVSVACWMAKQHHAELHIVHVIAPTPVLVPSPETVPPAVLAPDQKEIVRARARMDALAQEVFPALAAPPVTCLLTGVPHQAIAQYARDLQIDLVVIGTHGRGLITRLFIGSMSKSILENSPCPVLLVPLGGDCSVTPELFERL
jgi:universal stress protein A